MNKYLEKIAISLNVFKPAVTKPTIFNSAGLVMAKKPIGKLQTPSMGVMNQKRKLNVKSI